MPGGYNHYQRDFHRFSDDIDFFNVCFHRFGWHVAIIVLSQSTYFSTTVKRGSSMSSKDKPKSPSLFLKSTLSQLLVTHHIHKPLNDSNDTMTGGGESGILSL